MSQTTKKTIQQGFLSLLEKEPLDKITVKDLVESCNINRNTFYYYYKDIYDLLNDFFNEEINRLEVLENSITDWNIMLRRSAQLIIDNKKSITNIYNSKNRELLENYLFSASQKSIKKFIYSKPNIEERSTKENLKFICDFYSYTIVGMINHWIVEGMQIDSELFLEKMSKILSVSVDAAIDSL